MTIEQLSEAIYQYIDLKLGQIKTQLFHNPSANRQVDFEEFEKEYMQEYSGQKPLKHETFTMFLDLLQKMGFGNDTPFGATAIATLEQLEVFAAPGGASVELGDQHPVLGTDHFSLFVLDSGNQGLTTQVAYIYAGGKPSVWVRTGEPYGWTTWFEIGSDKVFKNASITPGTHTKVTYDAKGLVVSAVDATTADIAPSANRNYVSDVEKAAAANLPANTTLVLAAEAQERANADQYLQSQLTGAISGFLGSLAYNAAAPTPGKSGYYDFTGAGTSGAWLGSVAVAGGDRVYVNFTTPTYAYTFAKSEMVHSYGNEIIAGTKTFDASPIVPAPTEDGHPATRKFVIDSFATETPHKNLFDKTKVTQGFYLNSSDGSLVEDVAYWTSDFIKLSVNGIANQSFTFISFYDVNKAIISGITAAAQTGITVPVNTKFIRISENGAYNNINTLQVEVGNTSTAYESYGSTIEPKFAAKEDLAALILEVGNKTTEGYVDTQVSASDLLTDTKIEDALFTQSGKNLFDKTKITQGFYLNTSDGALVANADFWTSDFIQLPVNGIASTSFTFISFFDINKVIISGITTAGQLAITVPVNTKFVRISENATYNNINTLQVEVGNTSTEYEAYSEIPTAKYATYDIVKNGAKTQSITGRATYSWQESFDGAGIAANKDTVASGDGIIKSVKFYANKVADAHFAIGIRDQWGKALYSEIKTIPVTSIGLKEVEVNWTMLSGQMLFVMIGVTEPISYSTGEVGFENLLIYNNANTTGVLIDFPLNGFAILSCTFEYSDVSLNEVYNKIKLANTEINATKGDVSSLKTSTFITSKSGEKFKLVVSSLGALTTKSTIVNKVLALGNSITIHPITSFWWGNWGMAATTRAKDYVHQLESILKTKDNSSTVTAFGIGTWEQNHSTYNYSLLDAYLVSDLDSVLLRVAENTAGTNEANYEADFTTLINYIYSKCPNVDIIVMGSFWGNLVTQQKNVCNALGLPFIDISYMGSNPTYSNSLDTQVYGDDNVWHSISEGGEIAAGVAAHPNDKAMLEMAQLFANALGY